MNIYISGKTAVCATPRRKTVKWEQNNCSSVLPHNPEENAKWKVKQSSVLPPPSSTEGKFRNLTQNFLLKHRAFREVFCAKDQQVSHVS